MAIGMSLALATAITTATADHAEARRGRGAAIVGGIALGALALGAAGAYDRHYYRAGLSRAEGMPLGRRRMLLEPLGRGSLHRRLPQMLAAHLLRLRFGASGA